jgi:hypothetical protein
MDRRVIEWARLYFKLPASASNKKLKKLADNSLAGNIYQLGLAWSDILAAFKHSIR